MMIVRYLAPGGDVQIGLQIDDQIRPLSVGSVAELLRLSTAEIKSICAGSTGEAQIGIGEVKLLAPVDGLTEVWAAGVTYADSRRARMIESEHAADIYDRVYGADRPELFFKAVPWKVVGMNQPVRLRADSEINVPEAELAVIANKDAEIVGFAVCNDVSSRSLEGENPLYLPQAKIYDGSCALGPGIRPVWEVDNPDDLTIQVSIVRDGASVWSGKASTAQLNRSITELLQYVFRDQTFPDGVVLSTGTCLVPDLPFTLAGDDLVTIEIEMVGALSNPVAPDGPPVSPTPLTNAAQQRS